MNPGTRHALVIARRSRKNLKVFDALKAQGADIEEVTQLINSMFGMLICLQQDYLHGRGVTWHDVEKHGLTPIPIEGDPPNNKSPKLKSSKTFSQLIRNLRNALAHNNFDFEGNPITSMTFWNFPSREKDKTTKNRVWQTKLSVDQLRQIAYLLIDLLEIEYGHHLPNPSAV